MMSRKGKRNKVKPKPIVSTNGYLVIFEPNHPLAMRNGYVYVHRKVLSEKLGRNLEDGEQVHHIDGDKTNNNPDNLELIDIREHTSKHHKNRDDIRGLNESNPMIFCACGCGHQFKKYDSVGRPRKFVSGHNMK